MLPSPSLGPPLLSESPSPPLFCGIPPLGVEWVVVVGGGVTVCVVVWVVVGGGGGVVVVTVGVVVIGVGAAVVVGAGAGGAAFLCALRWVLCLTGFAAAVVVELVLVVDVALVVLDVLALPPQPASASAPAIDRDSNSFLDIAVRFPLGGISW
ncbi:MAG TPA: hypothetical protein VG410_13145 [Solirubrobacteraceae bacterium]|jgi:hypothetical protein|nr:hypothetical protein [Solirubrobacteraceae bacterium]